MAIVTKRYRYGCITDILSSKRENGMAFTVDLIFQLSRKITLALEIIHSKNFTYNNMNLLNIMLDGDDEELVFPVLINFRVATPFTRDKIEQGFDFVSTDTQALSYFAPEVLTCFKYKIDRVCSIKTDIYSLGIVLLELFSKTRFFPKFNFNYVISGRGPEVDINQVISNFDNLQMQTAIDIMGAIMDCLEIDPEKRPSINGINEFMQKSFKF